MGYRIQGAGCRVQDAGARRVSNAEGMRRMVRKHDCALPAQYTKHSNARGHSLAIGAYWINITEKCKSRLLPDTRFKFWKR
jgi:hypothetical protein